MCYWYTKINIYQLSYILNKPDILFLYIGIDIKLETKLWFNDDMDNDL